MYDGDVKRTATSSLLRCFSSLPEGLAMGTREMKSHFQISRVKKTVARNSQLCKIRSSKENFNLHRRTRRFQRLVRLERFSSRLKLGGLPTPRRALVWNGRTIEPTLHLTQWAGLPPLFK